MIPRALALLVLAFLAVPLAAQSPGQASAPSWQASAPEPLYQNPGGRRHIDLSGPWQVLVDPLSAGDRPSFTGLGGVEVFRARPEPRGLAFAEFVFNPAETLQVPADWVRQNPRLDLYEGAVWYLKRFELPAAPDGLRRILHVGAANYRTDVYINGTLVARHEGGFTPFAVDLTRHLKPGSNALVLKVDNRLDSLTVPTRFSDWHNYGGITGAVRLLELPEQRLVTWAIRLADLERREVVAEIEASPEAAGRTLTVSLPEIGESAKATIGPDGRARLVWHTRAGLWSPQQPTLHRVRIAIAGGEATEDVIGLRTIEARGGDIFLNGERIVLRGISAHAVTTRHAGRAVGEEDARQLVGEVKALGANFVRLAHYPHDEAVAREADRQGLLVWSELPVYWAVAFESPQVLENVRRQARAMVERDRNRASIILWSIANETPDTPARLAFLRAIAGEVRQRDPSRLITAALLVDTAKSAPLLARTLAARLLQDPALPTDQRQKLAAWFEKASGTPATPDALAAATKAPVFRIDDPLAEVLDVAALNEYFGWYYASFLARMVPADEERLAAAILALMPEVRFVPPAGKPFVVSEFGADAKAGLPGGAGRMFTEEYQAEVYRRQLAMLAAHEGIDGVSPWVLQDFRSPLRPFPGIQDGYNRKGVIDETGRRKLAFAVLREAYLSGWPQR
ncbi:glycoside hydrolase family 2 TIM barrel-domain containing protein [Erythrobacter sp. NE805]|uniref:glycoside hydrolase family 2 TIM barrel-domain containing protein n=1 Tax=Erythrobacter sp. NE805 TaxID=3389875 RepID=UPI00396AF627